VLAALARNPNNKSEAARELGMTRNGLYGALKRMGWQAPPELRAIRAKSGSTGAKERWS
jgi:DNA-binding NtrC family response regulator